MFEQAVQLFFSDWLAAFFNPQKRIFWGYLVSAFVIALLWLLIVKRENFGTSIKQIFSRESWLSKSARADYLLMIINGVIMTFLSPRLLGKAVVASVLFFWLHDVFDGRALIATEIPAEVIAIAFTLFLFVVDDFARYWLHRWLHTFPFLWSFHKVHHSATTLNPFTVFRTHPVEGVLFTLRSALVQGISVAIFIFFFGDKVTLVMVLGASIFTFYSIYWVQIYAIARCRSRIGIGWKSFLCHLPSIIFITLMRQNILIKTLVWYFRYGIYGLDRIVIQKKTKRYRLA